MKKLNLIYTSLLLAIIASAGLTVWFCIKSNPVWGLYSGLTGIALTIWLIYLINRHFRLFRNILLSIGDDDFSSMGFKKNSFSPYFSYDLERAITQYKRREKHKESLLLSYELLLDKTETAFIIFMPDGSVDWINKAALLSIGNISCLERLDTLCGGAAQKIRDCKAGETFVMQFVRNDTLYNMAVSATRLNEKTIITLKNIRNVLDENELVAWQRLISVLTHEIMNSLSPIISLSDTLTSYVKDETAQKALSTIKRRGEGLQKFVENYRKISKVPLPMKSNFLISSLIQDIRNYFPNTDIAFRESCHDIMINADRAQMEQVLINIIKNANEAESAMPIEIEASVNQFNNKVIINVKDKGNGMSDEVMEKIFVPFFSTKPNGSGIGLSICKQIISLHGGNIRVTSEEGKGSCFRITI